MHQEIKEMMVFAVLEGNPVLKGKILRNDSLITPIYFRSRTSKWSNFLVVPPDPGIFKIMEEVLGRNQMKPGKFLEFPDSNLTYKLACENMSIAFVQDTTVLYPGCHKKAYYCTLDRPPVRSHIAGVYRTGEIISPLAERFLIITEDVVKSSPYLQVQRS